MTKKGFLIDFLIKSIVVMNHSFYVYCVAYFQIGFAPRFSLYSPVLFGAGNSIPLFTKLNSTNPIRKYATQ